MAGLAILLAGCTSFGDLTSDAFDPGTATQTQFLLVSTHCQEEGERERDATIIGIAGTHQERHEIFNRTYTRCMAQNGFARRDWSPEIPVPYAIDPTP